MKTAVILSFFVAAIAVAAVDVERVNFGFSGGYKIGTWAPCVVTLQNQDAGTPFKGELAVEVRNFSSPAAMERYATPVHLIGNEPQQEAFYIYCPKNATQLVVRLVPTDPLGISSSHLMKDMLLPTPFARKDCFLLAVAPSGDKLKRFVDKKMLPGDARLQVKYLPNLRALPRSWIGYSAVDTVVLRGVRLTDRRVSLAQQTAILDWIQRGGTLIVSGGNSYNYLHGSFIEPYLPVQLEALEKIERLPKSVSEQLGFHGTHPFERIRFVPNPGCEVLIGTEEQIYVAKRTFGDGQILCLAFDYNAPPFSEQPAAAAFWHGLLSAHGKSPRHFEDQYALSLEHEAKTYEHFLSQLPDQVPLIKRLAIVLPIYLLCLGGFLFYFGSSERKSRVYWIGGGLIVLISVAAITSAQKVFPNMLAAERLSVLSVYPEEQRGHLLSYVSLRAASPAKTSIGFTEDTFIRHQEGEMPIGQTDDDTLGTSLQTPPVQYRELPVAPWHPTTFVTETFLTVDAQHLPRTLENAWRVVGEEMTYLGNVTLNDVNGSAAAAEPLRRQVTPKMPPSHGLAGTRKTFARILQRDYVLRYLATDGERTRAPYFIGWTSHSFTDLATDAKIDTTDETLVIFRPTAAHLHVNSE